MSAATVAKTFEIAPQPVRSCMDPLCMACCAGTCQSEAEPTRPAPVPTRYQRRMMVAAAKKTIGWTALGDAAAARHFTHREDIPWLPLAAQHRALAAWGRYESELADYRAARERWERIHDEERRAGSMAYPCNW